MFLSVTGTLQRVMGTYIGFRLQVDLVSRLTRGIAEDLALGWSPSLSCHVGEFAAGYLALQPPHPKA